MMPHDDRNVDGASELAALDEIMQVMFCLRGEQLALDVSRAAFVLWVGHEASHIECLLQRLAAKGLVEPVAATPGESAYFRLTSDGVRVGGRRFADEFADMTRPGHGECNDPDCDCQRTGNP